MKFRCILADPPWSLALSGRRKRTKGGHGAAQLAYPTMTVPEICALQVGNFAEDDCHLWLWTTNQHLRDGFRVMDAWGFKYLAPIHWIKPSGIGCWFVHRTQTLLFGYRKSCRFPLSRYAPNVLQANDPKRHSQKPEESFQYIERISPGPRLEMFARQRREGWQAWGNEVASDITLAAA